MRRIAIASYRGKHELTIFEHLKREPLAVGRPHRYVVRIANDWNRPHRYSVQRLDHESLNVCFCKKGSRPVGHDKHKR